MRSWPEALRARGLGIAWIGAGGLLGASASVARAEPTFFTARVAPIMEKHCVVCHGAEKQKAGLRVDSFTALMKGAESGAVVKPGDVKASELFRRITLPRDHDEVMPSDGKPLLAAEEVRLVELWIQADASETKPLSDFPTAPVPKLVRAVAEPLAPDWRAQAPEIAAFEKQTGLKLVPRSQVPTDGLILRTASAPRRCDDAVLQQLTPLGRFIVEAELARTKVSDAGLAVVAGWTNLRSLDLTHTGVTSAGMSALAPLQKLEALNLTNTRVDDRGVERIKALPALRRLWLFGTPASTTEAAEQVVAK